MKVCSKCHLEKDLSSFVRNKRNKDREKIIVFILVRKFTLTFDGMISTGETKWFDLYLSCILIVRYSSLFELN